MQNKSIHKSQIKYLCFDIGNVLFQLQWEIAFEQVTQTPFEATFEESFKNFSNSKIHWDFETGICDASHFFTKLQELFHSQGFALDLLQVEAFWSKGLGQPYPWIAASVAALAKSFQLIALSNTNPFHYQHFLQAPELTSFQKIFCSHELGVRKPAVQIYEKVMAELGVPPESILFMDDLIENIESAHKVGWQAIHCPDSQALFASLPKILKIDSF